jgi:hypothetical protein
VGDDGRRTECEASNKNSALTDFDGFLIESCSETLSSDFRPDLVSRLLLCFRKTLRTKHKMLKMVQFYFFTTLVLLLTMLQSGQSGHAVGPLRDDFLAGYFLAQHPP